jgi:hypothetical protein
MREFFWRGSLKERDFVEDKNRRGNETKIDIKGIG